MCCPALAPERMRKDGARSFCGSAEFSKTRQNGSEVSQVSESKIWAPMFVRELETGWDRFVVSHLRRKDKEAPKVGHPRFVPWRGKAKSKTTADSSTPLRTYSATATGGPWEQRESSKGGPPAQKSIRCNVVRYDERSWTAQL